MADSPIVNQTSGMCVALCAQTRCKVELLKPLYIYIASLQMAQKLRDACKDHDCKGAPKAKRMESVRLIPVAY